MAELKTRKTGASVEVFLSQLKDTQARGLRHDREVDEAGHACRREDVGTEHYWFREYSL